MLFSIITVCYNAEDKIRKTIESLKKQDFTDYEYIVVDGASIDGTFTIVKEFETQFTSIEVLSEPDQGIYDAMNKGVQRAKGEYVYFLNAGDTFYDDHVLSDMAKRISGKFDIYYGNVGKGNIIEHYPDNLNLFYLAWREKMVCHQAIFAKKTLLLDIPFDTNYKICADRKWIIECLKQGATYKQVDGVTVCEFEMDGVSSVYSNFDKESLDIAKTYVGSLAVLEIKLKRWFGRILNEIKAK